MNTYNKPEKPGIYLLNYGDIVTDQNMQAVAVYKNTNGELFFIDENKESIAISEMNDTSWQWFPASQVFKDVNEGYLKLKETEKAKEKTTKKNLARKT
jgi:hypothetical protein